MINVKDRDIVVPGELLGQGVRCEGLCVSEGESGYSLVRGLARVNGDRVSIIPSNGAYTPKPGDMVIGVITNDFGGVYFMDVDGPYICVLKPDRNGGFRGRAGGRGNRDRGGGRGNRGGPRMEKPETFEVGDLVSAKISHVDEVKEAKVVGPRKLGVGKVIRVKPMRVPRVIGKKKSMINLIRDYTGSKISVGQNGLIWIKDGDVNLAVEAIKKVEAEAQTSGLTDRVTEFLKSRSKRAK
ncbi:MAG: hypothetical protein GF416_05185 [Candidatus Altiarchaeales archaeon]|nr:hypothetical protein [Candidatus Altiarchaeales archaeon]MBD3416510.1 hypothetical protein [Candidatus Altiarchaeales archaeon]